MKDRSIRPTPEPRLGLGRHCMFFLLFFGVALVWAKLTGAFEREYISDSSIHFVTIAIARDYLRDGFPGNPITFLENYYAHYPMFGVGLWPPLFYGLGGLWTSLFGLNPASLMALCCAIAATGASAVFAALHSRLGFTALCGALIVLLMPTQVEGYQNLLIDSLCGLLCFLAAWAFARLLHETSWRNTFIFSLAALLALFCKGNALMLAFVPPLMIVSTRRWDMLRKQQLWVSALAIGLIAGPWYLLTAGLTAQGFRYSWGLAFAAMALPENLRLIWGNCGPLVILLALLGGWGQLRAGPPGPRQDYFWHAMLALGLGCFIFQLLVPASLNARYLFAAFFAMAAFAAAGVMITGNWLVDRLGASMLRQAPSALAFLAVAHTAWLGFNTHLVQAFGIRDVAAYVAALPAKQQGPVLLATSALSEAGFIAELLGQDKTRPSRFVVRGSKVFAKPGYFATEYQPLYKNRTAVAEELQRWSFPLIIVESSSKAKTWKHIDDIKSLIMAGGTGWHAIAHFPSSGGKPDFLLFARSAGHQLNMAKIKEINRNEMILKLAGKPLAAK
jgi:hypothetical protein